jgi:hypothetical protein
MESKLLFREDQCFRSPLLWIPLFCVTAFLSGTIIWMVSRQVFQDTPFGDDAMSNGKMLALGGLIILLNVLFLAFVARMKLQTEVTTAGLFLRFRPFQRKTRHIDLAGVTTVAAIEYRPAMEYGGWGLRNGRNGVAYNVTGNLGVRLEYDTGHHLLVGTCHPEELLAAIAAMMETQGIVCDLIALDDKEEYADENDTTELQ